MSEEHEMHQFLTPSTSVESSETREESESAEESGGDKQTMEKKKTSSCCRVDPESVIISIVNFFNVVLVVTKAWASYDAHSFSIANSAIESCGDLVVGALVQAAKTIKKHSKASRFPRGMASESVSTLSIAIIMLILATISCAKNTDDFFTREEHAIIALPHNSIVIGNILLKIFLFAVCKLSNSHEVTLLRRDQLCDVFTNTVTLVFAMLNTLHFCFDFLGGLVIYVIICIVWLPQLYTHGRKLCGGRASDTVHEAIGKELDDLSVTSSHSYVAFHAGERIIVEVDVLFKPEISNGVQLIRERISRLKHVVVVDVRSANVNATTSIKSTALPPV